MQRVRGTSRQRHLCQGCAKAPNSNVLRHTAGGQQMKGEWKEVRWLAPAAGHAGPESTLAFSKQKEYFPPESGLYVDNGPGTGGGTAPLVTPFAPPPPPRLETRLVCCLSCSPALSLRLLQKHHATSSPGAQGQEDLDAPGPHSDAFGYEGPVPYQTPAAYVSSSASSRSHAEPLYPPQANPRPLQTQLATLRSSWACSLCSATNTFSFLYVTPASFSPFFSGSLVSFPSRPRLGRPCSYKL